jgi:hypothetical protein
MEEQLDYALSKIEALEERIELLEQQLPQQETFVSKGSDDTPMERKLLKSGFVDIVPKEENHISDISKMVEVPKQETLYTEEQVREAIELTLEYETDIFGNLKKESINDIIQSLKQPKKD